MRGAIESAEMAVIGIISSKTVLVLASGGGMSSRKEAKGGCIGDLRQHRESKLTNIAKLIENKAKMEQTTLLILFNNIDLPGLMKSH